VSFTFDLFLRTPPYLFWSFAHPLSHPRRLKEDDCPKFLNDHDFTDGTIPLVVLLESKLASDKEGSDKLELDSDKGESEQEEPVAGPSTLVVAPENVNLDVLQMDDADMPGTADPANSDADENMDDESDGASSTDDDTDAEAQAADDLQPAVPPAADADAAPEADAQLYCRICNRIGMHASQPMTVARFDAHVRAKHAKEPELEDRIVTPL